MLMSFIHLILALGLTLGLIAILRFALERIGKNRATPSSEGEIRVRTLKRVDYRRTLMLIEENGHEHLILLGHTHDTVVHSRPMGTTLHPDEHSPW